METQLATLCIVERDGRVLLGMKKRGFGAGRWNGFGGKPEGGEDLATAARRELEEESGVIAAELVRAGILDFDSPGRFRMRVHVFRVPAFSGEPRETEEMRPQWFDAADLPYAEMWPSDLHWLPLFLAGKNFQGSFEFGEGDAVVRAEVKELAGLH